MRMFILMTCGLLGVLAAVSTATSANAAQGQWCSVSKGMRHCAYSTAKQCRASRSGRSGTCVQRQST